MTHSALIDGLLRPEAYPHPVETPVRLVETHVSWVLLTGPFAYKIKKPLKLPFLDYSTLSRRRHLCEEETRLNRRYAPDLYVGVVAIEETAGGLRVVPASDRALEYAVRMVQFDRSLELDALIASNAVEHTELDDFGRTLGAFHANAARASDEAEFGVPAAVHRVTRANLDEIASLGLAEAPPALVDLLTRTSDAAFAAVRESMAWRRATGWVRECHGDLHCGNVVRWRGALRPFDGIEFDPALRFIDVVSDTAFLSMDLAALGRTDLRSQLLNAWCETLGDYAGLALLPYYESYRAVVRAKVAAIRAGQAGAADASGDAVRAQVRQYLTWARAQADRPPPTLLLTCGLSGSGKTWLARRLATRLGALHVRSDVERKRLAGLGPLAASGSPPDGGIYTREFNVRTYARLRDCAQGCLQGRETVIVDAAFLRRAERHAMLELGSASGVRTVILHCSAPLDVLRRRVRERHASRADASEADVGLLDRQPGYWEPLDDEELAHTVAVDTSRDDAVVTAVISRLADLDVR